MNRRLWLSSVALGVAALLFCLLSLSTSSPAVRALAGEPETSPSPAAARPPGPAYVKVGGTGAWCLQGDPCGSLQYAVDLSLPGNGDIVYVAAGAYTSHGPSVVSITRSIALYGGWNGAPTGPVVCDPEAYAAVLDAESSRRGVFVAGTISVTLDGLTVSNAKLQGGTLAQGGGLYSSGADLTLRRVLFLTNSIYSDEYAYGAGAMVERGTVRIEASAFQDNYARAAFANGAGLAISGTLAAGVFDTAFVGNSGWIGNGLYFSGPVVAKTPLTIERCRFAGNSGGYAGALHVEQADARIEGSVFERNRASSGWGTVYILRSTLVMDRNFVCDNNAGGTRPSSIDLIEVAPFTLTNNVVAGNRVSASSEEVGAVNVAGGKGLLAQNTIARNQAHSGIHVMWSTVAITNTILVSHTVGITVEAWSTVSMEGTLWGSGAWANIENTGGPGSLSTGTVNFWADPRFVDPDHGDYHIRVNSAARKAGVATWVTRDIDGDRRGYDGPDIGADEFAWRVYLPLVTEDTLRAK